jgi:hypothetical protein
VIDSVFDFALFLTGTVIIFSTIGIACIGLGAYLVLRSDSREQEIEIQKNVSHNKTSNIWKSITNRFHY